MSNGFLTQEEINALISGGVDDAPSEKNEETAVENTMTQAEIENAIAQSEIDNNIETNKKQIAVLVDAEGNLSEIANQDKILVYELEKQVGSDKTWRVTETIYLNNMSEKREIERLDIKKRLDTIIKSTQMCKVIVAKIIIGIPYYILSRAGYEICEAEILSQELLNQIWEDYYEDKKVAEDENNDIKTKNSKVNYVNEDSVEIDNKINPQKNISKYPTPLDAAGNFFVNIMDVQEAHPGLSTKKILVPFFTDTLFHTLEIKCSHIMPWLEAYTSQRNWDVKVTRTPGIYTIMISHKLCEASGV